MKYDILKTNFCDIILVGDENGLTYIHLDIGKEKGKFKILSTWEKNEKFFEKEKKQLLEYFEGKRKDFDIKLNFVGTSFQKKVWQELTKIPYGSVCSYKDIAEKIGNLKACRAVGMANSKNPIPIIAACHRVIGSNGKLVGFASGLDVKQKLLDLEKKNSK